MKKILESFFGSQSSREIKRITPFSDKVLALDETIQALSDEVLRGKTEEFRMRLKAGETEDDLLPEAFAVCREAAWRVLGMKHYPVQLIGGVVLHQGDIAEMKTGEGKTLVATLAVYLNALSGKGVHVVTVNDYLAKRDMEWMGKVYEFLGLTTGCIVHGLNDVERKAAYAADVTYGTNNEFGFDYLRDNMAVFKERRVQRPLHYAIVDEVDSILIDEARTPLIISGQGDTGSTLYQVANLFVKTLKGRKEDPNKVRGMEERLDRKFVEEEADFVIDEKGKSVSLGEKGVDKAEKYFNVDNLADLEHMELQHRINQALRANYLMFRDQDYVVKDGEVIIVDDFTGRLMMGRRYSEGLHQAIEAKEGVEIQKESKTLATITFQNYFRMYEKLSGMTGTAMTEEDEFRHIYSINVIEIPTNRPVVRLDYPDIVYKNGQGKFNAVIEEIVEAHKSGQPVLVGTVTIETSELLSTMLKRRGVKHQVLNAKQHGKEAEIVAQAGRLGAVTIATNMAGRGTDIVLGGNPVFLAKSRLKKKYDDHMIEMADSYFETEDPEILTARETYVKALKTAKEELKDEQENVIAAGGLHIIGTERHESRRIDNQLRGRSGRQGDPGASRFYISLDDDLMRLFGGERVQSMVERLGLPDDEPIEAKILSRSIESAQEKIEMRNFGIRKNVLQYDDVMNTQRNMIYEQRRHVLEGESLKDQIEEMIDGVIEAEVAHFTQARYPEDWKLGELAESIGQYFPLDNALKIERVEDLTKEKLTQILKEQAMTGYGIQEEAFGEQIREIERIVLLQTVDKRWMDHIDAMDQLRRGVGLRAMGQEDPVRAYQNEGYEMFNAMTHTIREETVKTMYRVRPQRKMERKQVAHITGTSGGEAPAKAKTVVRSKKKIGRNDPCPCGSGKKYKKCCGKDA
jgi:preprotein translocase subunit SecA